MENSVDLFSGCGAMSLALSGIFKPIAYCDVDEHARAILAANMKRGLLPKAPVYDDVRTMPCPRAEAVVASPPCTGWSSYGHQKGFDNPQSALFYDMLRVLDGSGASAVFLENVPGVVKGAPAMIGELSTKRGFELRWCIMGACDAGAPHTRKRWFCLGLKPRSPLKRQILDVMGTYHPCDWSKASPPRTLRMDSPAERRAAKLRWGVLGNAVVADVVRLAFLRMFTMGAVPRLAPGTAKFTPSKPYIAKAKSGPITVVVDSIARAVTPKVPVAITSRKQRLIIDPDVLPLPPNISPLQSSPVVRFPILLTLWSTPRYGNTGPCHVLTERSSRDLPTQIKFEKSTLNRTDPANPEFGEWMMGMPRGFTMPV